MKKLRKAMIGAVLCALPLMASGQDIHWQARGGIGYSTAFAGVTNIKDRVGFHVGGGADIGLSKNGVWRFQPSLQFVRKGWKFDGFYGNEQIMEAQYGTRLDYLQLPLQMAARLRLGKDCFLTFRSGGYVERAEHRSQRDVRCEPLQPSLRFQLMCLRQGKPQGGLSVVQPLGCWRVWRHGPDGRPHHHRL